MESRWTHLSIALIVIGTSFYEFISSLGSGVDGIGPAHKPRPAGIA
ncbi:MAG: hypothetical protein GYB68_07545 [Chloroflexi bacterium]|nr:hypothetical protein [Chloroflexota bacterium]